MDQGNFGFSYPPFSEYLETDFLVLTDVHRTAFEEITRQLEDGHPGIMLIGEPGVGKSAVLRALFQDGGLESRFHGMHVPEPESPADQPLAWLRSALGLEGGGAAASPGAIAAAFGEIHARGRRPLLLIDDGRTLSEADIDGLNDVLASAHGGGPVCQVVIAGPASLTATRLRPGPDATGKRAWHQVDLAPMSLFDLADYMGGRIRRAGGDPESLFDDLAMMSIHKRSQGNAHLVNMLCEICLEAAGRANRRQIDLAFAQRAISDRLDFDAPDSAKDEADAPRTAPETRQGDSAGAMPETQDPDHQQGPRSDPADGALQRVARARGAQAARTDAMPEGGGQAARPRLQAADAPGPDRRPATAGQGARWAGAALPGAAGIGLAASVIGALFLANAVWPPAGDRGAVGLFEAPGSGTETAAGDFARQVGDAFTAGAAGREALRAEGAAAEIELADLRSRIDAARAELDAIEGDRIAAGAELEAVREEAAEMRAMVAGLRKEFEGAGWEETAAPGPGVGGDAPDTGGAVRMAANPLAETKPAGPSARAEAPGIAVDPAPVEALVPPDATRLQGLPAVPEEADAIFRQALGRTDPRDIAVAYARAAVRGHSRAAYYLGQMYDTGDGVVLAPETARAWYAAVAGDIAAAADLLAEMRDVAPSGPAFAEPIMSVATEEVIELVWQGRGPFLVELASEPSVASAYYETSRSAALLPTVSGIGWWRVSARGAVAGEWVRIGLGAAGAN